MSVVAPDPVVVLVRSRVGLGVDAGIAVGKGLTVVSLVLDTVAAAAIELVLCVVPGAGVEAGKGAVFILSTIMVPEVPGQLPRPSSTETAERLIGSPVAKSSVHGP